MHSDPEADELQALLHAEYGAPRLDGPFSADLLARLQAEASARPSPPLTPPFMPSLTPARPRRSLLAISLGSAAVAASVIAIIWIANSGTPGTNGGVAHRAQIDSSGSAHPELSPLTVESEHKHLDHQRASPQSLTLSKSLSRESKGSSESRAPREEGLVTDERMPGGHSLSATLSVPDVYQDRQGISAAVALADVLYVVDGGHLYEVSPGDGSRRGVGNDNWQDTAAMGAAGGHLYLVSGNQLYEVNPKTGARRRMGEPTWANTKAIVTAGDKLYIASNGLLHRVNPSDGSHEVLHGTNDRPNNPRQPKP